MYRYVVASAVVRAKKIKWDPGLEGGTPQGTSPEGGRSPSSFFLTCLPYGNSGEHVFNFCGTLPDKNEDCAKAVMVRASVIVRTKTSCHGVKSPFVPPRYPS